MPQFSADAAKSSRLSCARLAFSPEATIRHIWLYNSSEIRLFVQFGHDNAKLAMTNNLHFERKDL
jgi:hypothetical protein